MTPPFGRATSSSTCLVVLTFLSAGWSRLSPTQEASPEEFLASALELAFVVPSAPDAARPARFQRGGRSWLPITPAACDTGLRFGDLPAWYPLTERTADQEPASTPTDGGLPAPPWLDFLQPRVVASAEAIRLHREPDGTLTGNVTLHARAGEVRVTRTSAGCALRLGATLPLVVGAEGAELSLSWKANDVTDAGRHALVLWDERGVLARLPLVPPPDAHDAWCEPESLDFGRTPAGTVHVRGRLAPLAVELISSPDCVRADVSPAGAAGWVVVATETPVALGFHRCAGLRLAYRNTVRGIRGELRIPVLHDPRPSLPLRRLSALLSVEESFLVLRRGEDLRLAYPDRMSSYRPLWAAAGWTRAAEGRAPGSTGPWTDRVQLTDGGVLELDAEVVPAPVRPRRD